MSWRNRKPGRQSKAQAKLLVSTKYSCWKKYINSAHTFLALRKSCDVVVVVVPKACLLYDMFRMYAEVTTALIAALIAAIAVTTRTKWNKYVLRKARVRLSNCSSALWTAAQRGDAVRLETLLCSIDAFRFAKELSYTRLMLQLVWIAVLNDHVHAVKVICSAMENCMRQTPPYRLHRLHLHLGLAARTNQDGRVIAALVEANACVNHLWDGYQSALHTAAISNNCGGVDVLLRLKADVNANAMNYGTPLHFAAFMDSSAAAQLLLGQGASSRALAQCIMCVPHHQVSGTPLDWAQRRGNADTAHIIELAMRMDDLRALSERLASVNHN